MAVQRDIPKCPWCGKPTAKPIFDNSNPLFLGDTFTGWKDLEHTCKGFREWKKKINKECPKITMDDLIAKKKDDK